MWEASVDALEAHRRDARPLAPRPSLDAKRVFPDRLLRDWRRTCWWERWNPPTPKCTMPVWSSARSHASAGARVTEPLIARVLKERACASRNASDSDVFTQYDSGGEVRLTRFRSTETRKRVDNFVPPQTESPYAKIETCPTFPKNSRNARFRVYAVPLFRRRKKKNGPRAIPRVEPKKKIPKVRNQIRDVRRFDSRNRPGRFPAARGARADSAIRQVRAGKVCHPQKKPGKARKRCLCGGSRTSTKRAA